jgi:hypothetical protein
MNWNVPRTYKEATEERTFAVCRTSVSKLSFRSCARSKIDSCPLQDAGVGASEGLDPCLGSLARRRFCPGGAEPSRFRTSRACTPADQRPVSGGGRRFSRDGLHVAARSAHEQMFDHSSLWNRPRLPPFHAAAALGAKSRADVLGLIFCRHRPTTRQTANGAQFGSDAGPSYRENEK